MYRTYTPCPCIIDRGSDEVVESETETHDRLSSQESLLHKKQQLDLRMVRTSDSYIQFLIQAEAET